MLQIMLQIVRDSGIHCSPPVIYQTAFEVKPWLIAATAIVPHINNGKANDRGLA